MDLGQESQDKLRKWLNVGTWHTGDLRDMNRWYAFVNAYQREHGYTIAETSLREHIEQMFDGGVSEDLREWIRGQISLAYKILDFLKHTGR